MQKKFNEGDLVLLKKRTCVSSGHPTKVLMYECQKNSRQKNEPNWGKIFHINSETPGILIETTFSGNYWRILVKEKISWTFYKNLEKL